VSSDTFAIGHFALGYIFGKSSAKLAKVEINLPLLFTASVLPDIDLLLHFITHRGPTHSIITITLLMIFFFAYYGKKAIPYYAALLSHVLVGDFFTGGVELFWPLSDGLIQFLNLEVTSLPSITAELSLFLITLPAMYKLGDLQTLLKFNSKSWILFIPIGSLLGPLLFIGRGQESALPLLLVVPSLFYLVLFSYALIIWLNQHSLKRPPERS
jgi:membrane-bound metal-dependent hydrolase YbcI (DUF457 family)